MRYGGCGCGHWNFERSVRSFSQFTEECAHPSGMQGGAFYLRQSAAILSCRFWENTALVSQPVSVSDSARVEIITPVAHALRSLAGRFPLDPPAMCTCRTRGSSRISRRCEAASSPVPWCDAAALTDRVALGGAALGGWRRSAGTRGRQHRPTKSDLPSQLVSFTLWFYLCRRRRRRRHCEPGW
jgi:hypothetical protein